MHTYIQTDRQTHTYIHTYIHTYTCTYTFKYIHTDTHTFTQLMFVVIHFLHAVDTEALIYKCSPASFILSIHHPPLGALVADKKVLGNPENKNHRCAKWPLNHGEFPI